MEDDFAALLERLGYRVFRKRDAKSGLDIIAKFDGRPILASPNSCSLMKPVFAPCGTVCFSLKRGDFGRSDVKELLRKRDKAVRISDDELLRSITGCLIATNYAKTESELDNLLSKEVYCWDIRRLIFYSAKARSVSALAQTGSVREYLMCQPLKASYLVQTETQPGTIIVNCAILIDDHHTGLILSADHVTSLLSEIYQKSLKPIVESTGLSVSAHFGIHVLGIADKTLVEKAYLDFAGDPSIRPHVSFGVGPVVIQYGAAPWTALLT